MFTSCVQTALRMQSHMLKASFATVQLLCQLHVDPVYPVHRQCGVIAR